jgi:hypothetical protein
MSGMKRTTIEHVIRKKIDNWLESITDETVRKAAARDTLVTGGCITSMLLGEDVNDYDVYFRTKETARTVAEYYINLFNTANESKSKVGSYAPSLREEKRRNIKGVNEDRLVIFIKSAGVAAEEQEVDYEYFEGRTPQAAENFVQDVAVKARGKGRPKTDPRYRPVFLSDNAVTLSDSIQVMIRFFGSPDEIHGNYDFVHCMNYYDHNTKKVTLHPEALEACLSKTLIYKGSLYPICSLFRIRKFLDRGWRITTGQMLKMIWQVSEIDLKDFNILKDQLIGVDVAYMHQLLDKLKNHEAEIDAAYITKIIDELFD